MLDKHIELPCDLWDDLTNDCDWIEDLYEEWQSKEEALHNYECKVFNELDRRII